MFALVDEADHSPRTRRRLAEKARKEKEERNKKKELWKELEGKRKNELEQTNRRKMELWKKAESCFVCRSVE